MLFSLRAVLNSSATAGHSLVAAGGGGGGGGGGGQFAVAVGAEGWCGRCWCLWIGGARSGDLLGEQTACWCETPRETVLAAASTGTAATTVQAHY